MSASSVAGTAAAIEIRVAARIEIFMLRKLGGCLLWDWTFVAPI